MLAILVVCLFAGAMMVSEHMRPGRSWPQVRGWSGRSLAFTLVQALIVLWAVAVFRHAPPTPEGIGASTLLGETALGYLLLTFVYYWWHRARHEVGWLW